MVTRNGRADAGFTLVEMLVVVALLGVTLTGVYAVVFAVSTATAQTMDQVAATNDLGRTMELIGQTIQGSRLVYADDDRLVMLVQTGANAYQMNEIYVTTGTAASADRGNLVWEKWGADASGASVVGSSHTVWVVSDRNANLYTAPPTALFVYFRDATDASAMASADKALSSDTSVAAFTGTLPAGYPVGTVGRVRMHLVSALLGSSKDDAKDIALRLRN